MLNYIWAGLIILSLVFALVSDFGDITADRYRNGEALPVSLEFPDGFREDAPRQPVQLRIDSTDFRAFYGVDGTPEAAYPAVLRRTDQGLELRLDDAEAALPAPLDVIRDQTNPRDQILQARLDGLTLSPADTASGATVSGATLAATSLRFPAVRFVKIGAITEAALDFAETAVTIALGLIGILVLFLGLTRIAQDAGIIDALVRFVRPVLGPLFPGVPKDHPAMGMIALNLAANVFGLGNAATPFGIKAMEELQTLNPEPDTATDAMVMLLAMNTASVQLIPPLTLIAIIGIETNAVYFPILFTTIGSLIVAITVAKVLSKTKRYRATNPLLRAEAAGTDSEV